MLRLLAVFIGLISTSVILIEMVGVGILWSKGCLTNSNLYEMRLILAGGAGPEDAEQVGGAKSDGISQQEVQSARLLRVLDLESREKELELLKTLMENRANQLISDQKSFDVMREQFRAELVRLSDSQQTEAVEQARAVLLASAVEAAVQRLMELSEYEAVSIVRGMPEKQIAKILQGFESGPATSTTAAERRTRGQKIFEALSRGEPAQSLVKDTLDSVPEGAAAPPTGGG